jgi:tetratricopeptide (TPR) repeat protein
MKRLITFTMLLCGAIFSRAQTIEEEIGFKFVKAEYLFSTERFEDAIKELNEVIKQNSAYKNALLLRAETKYKLAAFKGAKMDAIEYINTNGVTARATAIIGKSDYAMGAQSNVVFNSVDAAIKLGDEDMKLYEIRAQIHHDQGRKFKACDDWTKAAQLGSTNAAIQAKKMCGSKVEVNTGPSTPAPQAEPTTQNDNAEPTTTEVSNPEPSSDAGATDTTIVEVVSGDIVKDSTATEVAVDLRIPEEDNTKNTIVIDEELSLEIYGQGLGKRAIIERPNILILAEKDGVVTVEICVNDKGIVEYAEFVPNKSTLNQSSLVSLAIRKAKEFWFEDNDFPKQCGYISYVVKGS